jgi:hypothetical protein
LITFGKRQRLENPLSAARAHLAGRFAWCAVAALCLGGCMQTASNEPAPATTVVSTPLPLNANGDAPATSTSTKSDALTVAPASPTAKAAPAAAVAAPKAAAQPKPVAVSQPAASKAASSAGSAPLPLGPASTPAAAPAPSGPIVTKDGYPNINTTPVEPEGKLLSAEERKKVITELEALRTRQKPPPAEKGANANATQLAKEAQSHGANAIKKIQKCSDAKTAASDPDCQPPPDDAPAATSTEPPADSAPADDAGTEPLPAD